MTNKTVPLNGTSISPDMEDLAFNPVQEFIAGTYGSNQREQRARLQNLKSKF